MSKSVQHVEKTFKKVRLDPAKEVKFFLLKTPAANRRDEGCRRGAPYPRPPPPPLTVVAFIHLQLETSVQFRCCNHRLITEANEAELCIAIITFYPISFVGNSL